MKTTKKIGLFFATAAIVSTLAGCSSAGSKDLVSMKGGAIKEEQLYNRIKASTAGKQMLQQMVVTKALDQKYGKDLNQKNVDKLYNKYKDKYGAQFEQTLAQSGMTKESFKDSLKQNELIKVAIKKDAPVTKAEIKRAWKNYQEKRLTQHILVKEEKTANLVLDKLHNGAKFETLVKDFSIDSGTKENKGIVPAFDKNGKLVQEYKDAAFNLQKPGDITETPVKSQFGYHIIKLDKILKKDKLAKHEKELKTQIMDTKLQDQNTRNKIIKKALKEANVDIKDNDMKDILAGYGVNK